MSDSYEYDTFGNLLNKTGTTPNNYLYRGEQWDSDLGLYYLRARYYNPLTGRFMSRDPEEAKLTDPRTVHKYLYAGGDPANRVDPSGRDELVEAGVEIAIHSKETIQFGAEIALCDKATFLAIGELLKNPNNGNAVPDLGGNMAECVVDALKGLMSPGGVPIFY